MDNHMMMFPFGSLKKIGSCHGMRQLLHSLSTSTEKPKAALVDLENEPVKVNGTSKAPPKVRPWQRDDGFWMILVLLSFWGSKFGWNF